MDVFREAFYDWLTPTITTVVRKSALLEIGGFDESERFATDFDIWIRLARRYPFVASGEITANWRWHTQQLSANPERQWLATYKFRIRALHRVIADGDNDLAEQLKALLRQRWLRVSEQCRLRGVQGRGGGAHPRACRRAARP